MKFQLNGLGPTQGASRIRLVAAGAMLLFAAAGALASDLAAPELVLARSGHDGAIMQAGQFEAATLGQHDRSQGAQLTQVGSNNQLHVLQSGQGNTVTAQQHGADNSAAILQSGGYGVVDLEQRGTGNSANVSQGGLGSTCIGIGTELRGHSGVCPGHCHHCSNRDHERRQHYSILQLRHQRRAHHARVGQREQRADLADLAGRPVRHDPDQRLCRDHADGGQQSGENRPGP
jgi:hypothetical protein